MYLSLSLSLSTLKKRYNKGLAFSEEERDRLYLRGLLPPAVLPQRTQAARAMVNVRSKATDLDRFTYLTALQERNERLFHRVLGQHAEELLPVWGEPTLSSACAAHGLMFRALPRALFVGLADRGRVFQILKNWPERRVKVLCITDGARVGALGDLGVQAVGVPVSRAALYTALGGVDPAVCLPIALDAGTDNPDLLSSPFYVGARRPRGSGEEVAALLDELITAARARFGPSLFIHFENMRYRHLAAAVSACRSAGLPVWSDDIQGTAATVVAGVLAAQPLTGKGLADHTWLFVGDGPAGTHIAEMVAAAIARSQGGGGATGLVAARARLWLADSGGLVTRARPDAERLPDHALPYAHDGVPHAPDLAAAVAAIKPSVIVGTAGGGAGGGPPPATLRFSREVLETMAAAHTAPVILPLSAPVGEVSAEDAYAWTGGRAVFADRARRPGSGPLALADGSTRAPGSVQTAYLFPGVGLATVASRSTRLRDDAILAAAEALAGCVTPADLDAGRIFPPLPALREVALAVATAAAKRQYESGCATELPKPADVRAALEARMYNPAYKRYR